MTEIRFHGRGGQGTVVASKVLACALFMEGKYVQSFPAFGVERRGAPVTAFTRVDSKPILVRNYIYTPDILIILESTLINTVDVLQGLKKGGTIIVNSQDVPGGLKGNRGYRIAMVDASSIAVKWKLGSRTSPIVNTAILGAFSKVTGLVGLESLKNSIRDESPVKKENNVNACIEAYERVVELA